jgi:hypothetical protein
MKTIKQYVESGISTLDELKHSLQIAMRLEFATIPPYLCAQWSIRRDPDRVEGVLHRVVIPAFGRADSWPSPLRCDSFLPE